jgi:hypothetical protein
MLVDNQGAYAFAESCSHPDMQKEGMKKLVEYEELTHMMLHDGQYLL